jgi:hypothetical protein
MVDFVTHFTRDLIKRKHVHAKIILNIYINIHSSVINPLMYFNCRETNFDFGDNFVTCISNISSREKNLHIKIIVNAWNNMIYS